MQPDYEKTILGVCLLEDEGVLDTMCSLVRPDHFALDSHRRIFHGIQQLHLADKPVNLLTISKALHDGRDIESLGGWAYITDLTNGVPQRQATRSFCTTPRR